VEGLRHCRKAYFAKEAGKSPGKGNALPWRCLGRTTRGMGFREGCVSTGRSRPSPPTPVVDLLMKGDITIPIFHSQIFSEFLRGTERLTVART